MKQILVFGLIISLLLIIVGCGNEEVQAPEVMQVVTNDTAEDLVPVDLEPETPEIKSISINVLTKEWRLDADGQETVTLKTRDLEKGFKFTGSNCFLCGAQLFTLEDIVSENEVLIAYDDAVAPVGGGENPILIGSEGQCFHVESIDLGVDICIEIA